MEFQHLVLLQYQAALWSCSSTYVYKKLNGIGIQSRYKSDCSKIGLTLIQLSICEKVVSLGILKNNAGSDLTIRSRLVRIFYADSIGINL